MHVYWVYGAPTRCQPLEEALSRHLIQSALQGYWAGVWGGASSAQKRPLRSSSRVGPQVFLTLQPPRTGSFRGRVWVAGEGPGWGLPSL